MKLSEIKKEWLRVDELQEILCLPRSTTYKLVSDGHFICYKATKLGGERGPIRILTESVRAFLERQVALFQLEEGILTETVQGVHGVQDKREKGC